mmetsp:Transcript_58623/g.127320  ORF Transcript_58623/g.127320 Transcript_58623/m.127320 type:complete len:269 (-) Transcript_58623:546-1352(-)
MEDVFLPVLVEALLCARVGVGLDLHDHHLVSDADRGGGDGVSPHLEHPVLYDLGGLRRPAQRVRAVEPLLRHAPQVSRLDDQRRGANRLDLRRISLGPAHVDHVVVPRARVHIAKTVRRRLGGAGQIGNGLHVDVVRLRHHHVLLLDPLVEPRLLEKLNDGVRPVEYPEIAVVLEHRVGQLLDEDGRYVIFEPVWLSILRGAQAREACHLSARPARRRLLLPVVVHDARLPAVIDRSLTGEQRVERPPVVAALALVRPWVRLRQRRRG